MNNELIEKLRQSADKATYSFDGRAVVRAAIDEFEAALSQQQEAEPVERATFNAVEHELATIQSTVSSFESPAKAVAALIDWHVQVALDPNVNGQQEAEPVDACVAAIQYALETDDGLIFLRLWNEGEFDAIRKEWLDVPESVFIGADPLHPATPKPAACLGHGKCDDQGCPAHYAAQPQVPDAMAYLGAPLGSGTCADHYADGWNDCREAMLYLPKPAAQPQVPEGYQLVPAQPSPSMSIAGGKALHKHKINAGHYYNNDDAAVRCYKAMLSAAKEGQ